MGVPVEHLAIPDAQRHEPKGASTAGADHALFSNGDTTTTFRRIDFADIDGSPSFNLAMVEELSAISTTDQTLSTANTSVKVSFGSAQALTNVDLTAAGTVTFSTTGTYILSLVLSACKTSGASSTRLFFRQLHNATELDGLPCIRFNSSDNDNQKLVSKYTVIEATAGDTYELWIGSDTNNTIGLVSDPVPGGLSWTATNTPSAQLTIYSFG